MSSDNFDALEPSKESAWAGPVEPTRTVESAPPGASRRERPVSATPGGFVRPKALLLGSVIAAVAALLLGATAVFGSGALAGDKVVAGVHVGAVDLSGVSREEAAARLTSYYGYLGNGTISVKTPQGTQTIAYAQISRGPDVDKMVDAAMAVGRYNDPLTNFVERLRALGGGENVPVIVKLDPTALATELRQLVGASGINPIDATVSVVNGNFTIVPGTDGRGIDEKVVAAEILAQLGSPTAPSAIQVDGDFVTVAPSVTNGDAQAAIDAAHRMIANDVPLSYANPDTNKTKTYAIKAGDIQSKSWIMFGWRSDGTYGPVVDPAKVQAWVGDLGESYINTDPVQPKYRWDQTTGALTETAPGTDGRAVDVESTSIGVSSYLDGLAKGQTPASPVAIVTEAVKPRLGQDLSPDVLKNFVKIGDARVYFYPSESNGQGWNIRRPAEIFNGQIVWPGETFSYWGSIGPVDVAHGFRKGGVIKDGKSDHTGAIGGGICSSSTVMFQAAASAGLQIVERHAHGYYINRYTYPKKGGPQTSASIYAGMDATVYSNGVPGQGLDLKWRNDTNSPVIIKSRWTGKDKASSKNWIYIELWSLPTGRHVTFNTGTPANLVKPTSTVVYGIGSKSLKPGQKYYAEYATIGFDISRSRTVTYPDGTSHTDVWKSHYVKVDGLVQIGGPARTSPPPPTPTAPATLSLVPFAFGAIRRRKRR